MFGAKAPRLARAAVLAAAVAVWTVAAHAGSDERDVIPVSLDHATILKLDRQASTIVIGNPAIADALVQNGTMLVLTGKSYGRTNLIVLDAAGQQVASKIVEVSLPTDVVTIQRGPRRYSYDCRSRCESVLMLGDAAEPFNAIKDQVGARQGLAQGAAGN